jgi:hypothetical protein
MVHSAGDALSDHHTDEIPSFMMRIYSFGRLWVLYRFLRSWVLVKFSVIVVTSELARAGTVVRYPCIVSY